jgi:hypothetical protein
MEDGIEQNLKFSKDIAHRSTLSIKNSLIPFLPDKIKLFACEEFRWLLISLILTYNQQQEICRDYHM